VAQNKTIIIGSGFSGLSAACFLAQAGKDVVVLEQHAQPGGRARQLCADGFTFDMGPSWYWMPDVFDRFFAQFGKKVSDYYKLVRLDPSYRVYWPDGPMDIPADYAALKNLFEQIETGAGTKLDQFMAGAKFKYETGMHKLVYKPGHSIGEFADLDLMKGLVKLQVFSSASKHIARYFTHPKLVQLMEFPLLFLGALPHNTPALYSLMNYADMKLGTWYPMGGMYRIVDAMYELAQGLGVEFRFNERVTSLELEGKAIKNVLTEKDAFEAGHVIGSADYHFIEQQLLPEHYRTYSPQYWAGRIMAPSCLIYYIGLSKKLHNIRHHSLFFDTSFKEHSEAIYTHPKWPDSPLFYICCASQTDPSAAPPGGENLFLLIPVAVGITDTPEIRERYFKAIIQRLEQQTGEAVEEAIVYRKDYAPLDFINDYNAFKGNAYGLANTLLQTAILKPSMRSKKVSNLFYTGQLTVPGPGVPPSIISGEIAAREVLSHKTKRRPAGIVQ
jgi:phytoene desaturase